MEYLAFGLWFILIVITGIGLYRLWSSALGGAVVDWLMFPATLVAELAYSLGRRVTGRPAFGGVISPQDSSADPCRNAISGRFGLLVSMLASLLTMLCCLTALILLTRYLDNGTIRTMVTVRLIPELNITALPRQPPADWKTFWDQLQYQVVLLERLTTAWTRQDWSDWRTPVFVYGIAVFSIRLSAVRHDGRATLVVAAGLVALTSILAATVPVVDDLLTGDLWYLLTYIWATMLFLLAISLVGFGVKALLYLLVPALSRRSLA